MCNLHTFNFIFPPFFFFFIFLFYFFFFFSVCVCWGGGGGGMVQFTLIFSHFAGLACEEFVLNYPICATKAYT